MNSIDSYQLSNLLTQRIPFRILFVGEAAQEALLARLGPTERMHARQWSMVLTDADRVTQAKQLLVAEQTPAEFPIVVIDEDGSGASALRGKLESEKYSNALFLQGGVSGFTGTL